MRAYFFGNMYLSSIQQGIQSAHVTAELFYKYQIGSGSYKCDQYNQLMTWAQKHKTMILLNAGYSDELHSLQECFLNKNNPYPWAHVHESQEALDGAFTSIGIVVPERIYETAKYCREENVEISVFSNGCFGVAIGMPNNLSEFECNLIDYINKYPLAR